MLHPKCNRWHLEEYVVLGFLILALVSLFGCAAVPAPIRLGPGECVVLADHAQVIVAGSDCQMRRLYR